MKNEYGCLMIQYDIPWWNKFVSVIDKNDLYDMPGFGIEFEPHVTILYGFHDDVSFNSIKKYIDKINIPVQITMNVVSSFNNVASDFYNNDSYDVLKFDIVSPVLHKLNNFFKKLPNTNTFKEYHPHMTIAYLLPGKALRYETILAQPINLISSTFMFTDKLNHKDVWMIKGKDNENKK